MTFLNKSVNMPKLRDELAAAGINLLPADTISLESTLGPTDFSAFSPDGGGVGNLTITLKNSTPEKEAIISQVVGSHVP